MFPSRNYRLIVAPRKLDVLKTDICLGSDASSANMLVLRTPNFQGVTIRPMVPKHKHSIVYIYSPLNFLPRASSSISWIIFNFLRWKPWKPKVKSEKETDKIPLIQFQLFIFYKPGLLQENFHVRPLFSSDGHHGLIVSLRGQTLSRNVTNLNQ